MQEKLFNIISRIENLLDGGDSIIVAIDGRCGSGKTTLAASLSSHFDCNVFHMDDYFLRPEQRTAERLATAGENIDHERFLEEVMLPLKNMIMGKTSEKCATGMAWNCHTGEFEPFTFEDKRLNIVEGVYSMHPDLIDCYDYKFFLDVSENEQRGRIENRNTPEMVKRFYDEWIPMEEKYFEELGIRDKADIIYEISE